MIFTRRTKLIFARVAGVDMDVVERVLQQRMIEEDDWVLVD